jgi:hypothetical protein
LVALGAATLYGQYDPERTWANSGKPWTVAATVRGFYDDNPLTTPDGNRPGPNDSFGIEVKPAVYLNLPLDQTFIRAGYIYSLRYYEDRETSTDHNHEFLASLRHAFSPRHEIRVADSFVVSDEPSVVDDVGIITTPTRTDSDIFRNRGTIDYDVMLTQVLGLGFGYVNTWYDYEQEGDGSRSALLDRIEHLIRSDLRYQVNPSLVGLVGYQFGINTYTGDEFLVPGRVPPVMSEDRDSYSHYAYVGADHDFTPGLRGSMRVGFQYTDYHEADESQSNPYVDSALTWAFLPNSSLQVGVLHMRNATDIVAPDASGNITLDQESTSGYARVSHQILEDLTGSVMGQVQHSSWEGGTFDGDNETIYLVGLNLEYRLNRHVALETGYSFDRLSSDVPHRTYDRNRVWVGVRATY